MRFNIWIGALLVCFCQSQDQLTLAPARIWAAQRELNLILRELWPHVESREPADDMLYQEFSKRLNVVESSREYHYMTTHVRSFRYDWHRANFLLNTMRIRMVDIDADSTSPMQIVSTHSIAILRSMMLSVHQLCELADTKEKDVARAGALAAIDAFQFVKRALLLDDRIRTLQEDMFIDIIKKELLVLSGKFIDDPAMQRIFKPTESEPTPNELNNGVDIKQKELNHFLSRLTQNERNMIDMIEGVEVIRIENWKCAVYTRVGKWWLHTYSCNI